MDYYVQNKNTHERRALNVPQAPKDFLNLFSVKILGLQNVGYVHEPKKEPKTSRG